ncbi:MAG: TetR/AcrR family transcriptional regulator [Treponema sp.]|jgi:AcrR family transcriptional regulator|nr:TetR/AcrR family transcriptional regulator [Treponema sp.]
MDKKVTSRTLKALETRKNILEHGIRLIGEKGIDKVSIEEIAKAAGVSVGTFYYYYPSKSELLQGMPWRIDKYFEQEVTKKLTAESCAENIKIFFYYYARHTKMHGWKILKNLFVTDTAFVISDKRYLQLVLLDLVNRGQNSGEVSRSLTAKQIMRLMLIAAHGVVLDWAMSRGKSNVFTDMKEVTGRLFNSFLT